MGQTRDAAIEEMADLAEALFDLIEEEESDIDDLKRSVVEALAHQNLVNVELVSALSAIAAGGSPDTELDNLVMNMQAVHKSLVRAVTAWSDAED